MTKAVLFSRTANGAIALTVYYSTLSAVKSQFIISYKNQTFT